MAIWSLIWFWNQEERTFRPWFVVSLLSKKLAFPSAASVFFHKYHQIHDWSHVYSDADSLLPLKDLFSLLLLVHIITLFYLQAKQ